MDSKTLRNQFEVSGYFYKEKNHSFREFLDIKKKTSESKVPDLMVIMMNPGSSHPQGIKKDQDIPRDLLNKVVPTVPDNTQDQIMRVMLNFNLLYARVLNLSDLRDAKSSSFYTKINSLNKNQIDHSIFHNKRESDLERLFERKAKLIVAWGVNKALKELAETALEKIGSPLIGWKKPGNEWAYYHPLPRTSENQEKWINQVKKQIT
jgi:hypothetical protein